jgi:DMSO/TMAO reductase YedYZ heme-binding membrane subunit
MKFSNRSIQRPKAMVFLAGLAPAILLAWRGQHQHLATNPVEAISHATGKSTLRCR